MAASSMTTPALVSFHEGAEQLAGERDDQPLARGFAAHAGKPLTIPVRQRRLRLMDEPQPGELKRFRPQAGIPAFDAPCS